MEPSKRKAAGQDLLAALVIRGSRTIGELAKKNLKKIKFQGA